MIISICLGGEFSYNLTRIFLFYILFLSSNYTAIYSYIEDSISNIPQAIY